MLLDICSALLIGVGLFFGLTGALGLFRFPDFFTRVHSASITDSIVAILILLGLALQTNLDLVTVKLLFIMVFLLVTSPTASHALAKAARHGGLLSMPEQEEQKDSANPSGHSSKNEGSPADA